MRSSPNPASPTLRCEVILPPRFLSRPAPLRTPSPRAAGRGEQALSFSRCDPHPSHRHAVRILCSPHRSSPENAGGGCRHLTICASSHDQEEKKARKRNADRRVSYLRTLAVRRAQSAARSPLGVPPRLYANGTIHPKAQPGPGFVTHAAKRGGFPASRCGTSSDAPRAPVIVPAG